MEIAEMVTLSTVCFGECRSSSGTLPTEQLFTGQRLDSTGLYYYGARYYDPTIGRFISADTLVPDPANPQSLNRYSYCLNNPLKYIDPTGHDTNTVSRTDANGNTYYVTYDGEGNYLGTSDSIDDLANNLSYWNKQGTADFPLISTGGVSTVVPEPTVPTLDSSAIAVAVSSTAVLATDDLTGIGVADDILIPVAWGVALVTFTVVNHDAITKSIVQNIGTMKSALDTGMLWFKAHSSKARPSTEEQHQKGQERRIRDQGGEKKNKPGWQYRNGKP